MTIRSSFIVSVAAAGALVALSPTATAKTAGNVTVSQEARQTLNDMKKEAVEASEEANQLESILLNSTIQSDAHLEPLLALKQDVNRMGKEIVALEAERASLEPWEQQAIDKVLPLLQDAAANTNRAIEYFNENRTHLWSPEYHAYTVSVQHDVTQIAGTLNKHLKYEKVADQERHLQSTIEGGVN